MKSKKIFAVMCLILTFVSCFGVNAMEQRDQNSNSDRSKQMLVITDVPKEEVFPQTNGILQKGERNAILAFYAPVLIGSILFIPDIFNGSDIRSEYADILCDYVNSADGIIYWLKDEDKENNDKFFEAFSSVILKNCNIPDYEESVYFFHFCFYDVMSNEDCKRRAGSLIRDHFSHGDGYRFVPFILNGYFIRKVRHRTEVEFVWASHIKLFGEMIESARSDVNDLRENLGMLEKKKKKHKITWIIGLPVALLSVAGATFGGIKYGEHKATSKAKVPKAENKTGAQIRAVA